MKFWVVFIIFILLVVGIVLYYIQNDYDTKSETEIINQISNIEKNLIYEDYNVTQEYIMIYIEKNNPELYHKYMNYKESKASDEYIISIMLILCIACVIEMIIIICW